MAQPLDGIRVLDFTRVLSGPHATRMLTDLGADVIKIEPPSGDLTRFATLRARQPRLVYASITGYGSSGPWTKRRAYAPVVGAEAGITKAQGDARGSAYTNDPFSHADVYTAVEAATAIVAALYRREQTGEGCWIDVSMAQTMLGGALGSTDPSAGRPPVGPAALRRAQALGPTRVRCRVVEVELDAIVENVA